VAAALRPRIANLLTVIGSTPPVRHEAAPSALGAYVVVIFEFADHSVSLAYEESANTLTVVAPDDELAVRVPLAFSGLVR